MRKLFMLVVIALGLVGASFAGSASANRGGVSLEQGNPWNVFSPNPANPGDPVSVTVTTFQDNPVPNATVTFTGLKGVLTFLNDGDNACLPVSLNKVVCTYTDYAHSAKSDGYEFQVNPATVPGTYSIHVSVKTQDEDFDTVLGSASEDLSLTTPVPAVVPPITPATFTQVDNINACASAAVLRQDASLTDGRFLTLDRTSFDVDSALYEGATFVPAYYVQNFGATCDPPAGAVATGTFVDAVGTVDPADGATDNVYPYFTYGG